MRVPFPDFESWCFVHEMTHREMMDRERRLLLDFWMEKCIIDLLSSELGSFAQNPDFGYGKNDLTNPTFLTGNPVT